MRWGDPLIGRIEPYVLVGVAALLAVAYVVRAAVGYDNHYPRDLSQRHASTHLQHDAGQCVFLAFLRLHAGSADYP